MAATPQKWSETKSNLIEHFPHINELALEQIGQGLDAAQRHVLIHYDVREPDGHRRTRTILLGYIAPDHAATHDFLERVYHGPASTIKITDTFHLFALMAATYHGLWQQDDPSAPSFLQRLIDVVGVLSSAPLVIAVKMTAKSVDEGVVDEVLVVSAKDTEITRQ